MIVHFEMARADVHSAALRIWVQGEKLLQDEQSILEVRICDLKSQLDEHIVILVIDDAEAVAFEHLSIGHAPVAQVHLGALGKCVLASLHLKFIIVWHVVYDLIPDSLCHIFSHLDLPFTCTAAANFAHFGEFSGFRPHALAPKSFLFDKQVQIIVTLEPR